MNGPLLVAPEAACHSSLLDALAEDHAEARHLELDPVLLADPDEFAEYVQALRHDAEHPGAPDR